MNFPQALKRVRKNSLLLVFAAITTIAMFFPYRILHGVTLWGFQLNTWKYNELGDFIGGITAPALSFLGIYLLFKTYKSQKRELKETKQALKSQQASASLFSMIAILENIISSIRGKHPHPRMDGQIYEATSIGRDLLAQEYESFKNMLKKKEADEPYYYQFIEHKRMFEELLKKNISNVDFTSLVFETSGLEIDARYVKTGNMISVNDYENQIKTSASAYFEQSERRNLKQYFNYTESIIDFIIHEFKEPQERDFYFRIFYAQFSNHELCLTYYYSFCILKNKLHKKLIDTAFLRYLDTNTLVNKQHYHIYASKLQGNPIASAIK